MTFKSSAFFVVVPTKLPSGHGLRVDVEEGEERVGVSRTAAVFVEALNSDVVGEALTDVVELGAVGIVGVWCTVANMDLESLAIGEFVLAALVTCVCLEVINEACPTSSELEVTDLRVGVVLRLLEV